MATMKIKNGKISKNDCESIIALSNIPSLAFMTGFIGIGSFNNSTVGWILWFCAVLSTFILGLINKLFFKNDSIGVKSKAINVNTKKKLSKIVINSIAHSAQAMLIICACVVFFSVLISVLSIYFDMLSIPNSVQNLLTGMLEITKGITSCAEIESIHNRALSCAFLVGWSGLCVHFQVIALTEDTDVSLKKYFIYKGLQGIIVFLLTLLIL